MQKQTLTVSDKQLVFMCGRDYFENKNVVLH